MFLTMRFDQSVLLRLGVSLEVALINIFKIRSNTVQDRPIRTRIIIKI